MMEVIDYFVKQLPNAEVWLWGGLGSLIYAWVCLGMAGRLKNKGWKTGYTRKVFHFLIFFAAAPIQVYYGFGGVLAFGCGVSVVVLSSVMWGRRDVRGGWRGMCGSRYRAMAREKDRPYETRFILVPWLSTAMGGMIANYFFIEVAVLGYLVAGIGDAIAEPVGTRWGKHPYAVPSFASIRPHRTIEGSFAVFVGSLVGLGIGVVLLVSNGVLTMEFDWVLVGKLVVIAFCAMVLEASSPHGWDNLTMMVGPAMVAAIWLG